MNWRCDDTLRSLETTTGESFPDLAILHLDSCETCAELIEVAWGELAPQTHRTQPKQIISLEKPLEVSLDRERHGWRRLRSLKTTSRVGGVLAFAAGPVLAQVFFSLRADALVYPTSRWVFDSFLFGSAFGAAALLLLWPAHLRRPRFLPLPSERAFLLWAGWGLVVPLLVAIIGPAHLSHPESLPVAAGEFWGRVLACFRYGTALSLPILLAISLSSRLLPMSPGRLTLMSIFMGIVANWLLVIHCPLTGVAHLLGGHVTVAWVVTILSLVLIAAPRRKK